MTPENESCDLIISVATKRSPLVRLSSTLLMFSKDLSISTQQSNTFRGLFLALVNHKSQWTRDLSSGLTQSNKNCHVKMKVRMILPLLSAFISLLDSPKNSENSIIAKLAFSASPLPKTNSAPWRSTRWYMKPVILRLYILSSEGFKIHKFLRSLSRDT